MKKLSLRMMAVLMVALMVFGLAACGGTSDVDTSGGQSTASGKGWAEVKKNLPADANGKTLKVYDWTKESEYYGLGKANKAFQQETGIKVEFTQIPYDTYFTKISAQVNAQDAPDVIRVQGGARKEMVNLQPINKATKFDFTDAAWDQNVISHYTYNGNIYAVNMVDTPVYSPYVMYYNNKLIKDYNLDDPYELWKKGDGSWNWDKVFEMCETFLDEVDDESYSGFTTMAGFEYFHAAGVPPVTFDRKTTTFSHNLDNETFVKAAQNFAKWFEKGVQDKMLSNTAKFGGGKLLFYVSMGQLTASSSETFGAIRKAGALSCVPLPAFKEGVEDVQVMGEMMALGIPKTAKNAELAPYYMRYTLDREHYDMANYYNCNNAEETLKYIAEKGAKSGYAGYVMQKENAFGRNTNSVLDELRQSGTENVKTILDVYVPAMQAGIDEANKFYQGL